MQQPDGGLGGTTAGIPLVAAVSNQEEPSVSTTPPLEVRPRLRAGRRSGLERLTVIASIGSDAAPEADASNRRWHDL